MVINALSSFPFTILNLIFRLSLASCACEAGEAKSMTDIIKMQGMILKKVTGVFIKSEDAKLSTRQVEVKGKNYFVSHVDKTAEKLIIEGLRRLLPEAGYIAEEGTSTKKGDVYNWIIDPLDGTTNFIHGL